MDTALEIEVTRPSQESLQLRLGGAWTSPKAPPPLQVVEEHLDDRVQRVAFESAGIGPWDSTLLTFLLNLVRLGERRGFSVDDAGLPAGARRLLSLATAVPESDATPAAADPPGWLDRLGGRIVEATEEARSMTTFVGEVALATGRLCRGKARFRVSDLTLTIQECGAQALPIVTLISFLVGLILAFIAAIQLRQFGAQIYVADLVGLGMAREMGAMMTGIIMAGRTGAAFAAQLGTMTVNEEIDALSTFGIPPIDFLVIPRMLALILMMPLLVLYADLMGILGGLTVGVTILDLNLAEYLEETRLALSIPDFVTGLVKGAVYGVAIAVAGCMRGMQSGRSAAAVGDATTSAVVTSIVLIVLASASLTILYDVLGV